MNASKNLTDVFHAALQIPFDDTSKFVLMSDCHRGDGTQSDEFRKNLPIYQAALMHYYNKSYTYVEIGDGDELWENKNYEEIIHANSDIFMLLSSFYKENRLYFIYGNHDIVKCRDAYVKRNLYQFDSALERRKIPLFENIKIHEGLVLYHRVTNNKIFLVHGHQVDPFNYDTWRLARFLVRYLWRPLNLYGVNDPTSTAKNYKKKQKVDRMLIKWVKENKHMLIAGHTHRPIFPEVGQLPYFNDGSSVHPGSITAIEIDTGIIRLVKWNMKAREDGVLFVGSEVLAGPKWIRDYFKTS